MTVITTVRIIMVRRNRKVPFISSKSFLWRLTLRKLNVPSHIIRTLISRRELNSWPLLGQNNIKTNNFLSVKYRYIYHERFPTLTNSGEKEGLHEICSNWKCSC